MSEYGGIYRGAVHDINDPENRGRLRLLVPDVLGEAPSAWAEPVLPTAAQTVWMAGDRVWVQFESGDINRPVYQSRPEVRKEDLAGGVLPGIPVTPTPTAYAGPGAVVLTWEADENSVYDVYVVVTSDGSMPTADPGPDDLHPEGIGVLPAVWIRTLPNGTPLAPTDVAWFSLVARNEAGTADAPSPWVSGHVGMVDPNNLILTAALLLANNILAEAIQTKDLTVKGDLISNTLTALGKVAFRAPDNELGPGAKWILQKGTTAPASPVTVGQSVPNTIITGNTFGTHFGGGQVDGTDFYFVDDSYATTTPVHKVPLAGGAVSTVGPYWGANTLVTGIAKIGVNWYLLVWNGGTSKWDIQKYDSSWAFIGAVASVAPGSTIFQPVMGTDGTNLLWAFKNPSDNGLKIRVYNTSGVQQGSDLALVNYSANQLKGIIGGNFDYGAYRYIVAYEGLGPRVYTTAGVNQTVDQWNLDPSTETVSGLGWDPTAGKFVLLDMSINRLFTFTKDNWATGQLGNSSRYISHTWTDGTHETNPGPPAYYLANKRWRTSVTVSAGIPDGSTGFRAYMGQTPDATVDTTTETITSNAHGFSVGDIVQFGVVGTTNIKTGVNYYVVTVTTNTFKISTTLGGPALNITGTTGQTVNHSNPRTKRWQVADITGTTGFITDPPVLGSPSVNPPATNSYVDSSPSEVKSSNETVPGTPDIWLKGDGTYYLNPSKNLDDTGWIDLSSNVVAGDSPFTGTASNWFVGRRIGKMVRLEISRATVAAYTPTGGKATDGNFANINVAGPGTVPAAWRPAIHSSNWIAGPGKFDDTPVVIMLRPSDGAFVLVGGHYRAWALGDNAEFSFQFMLD